MECTSGRTTLHHLGHSTDTIGRLVDHVQHTYSPYKWQSMVCTEHSDNPNQFI
jgi:hypothetical protein